MVSKVDFAAEAQNAVQDAAAAPAPLPPFAHCRAAAALERSGWTRAVAGETDFHAAVDAFVECARYPNKGLYVCGVCGCGKTALVRAIVRRTRRQTEFIALDTDWEYLDVKVWPNFLAGLMVCNVVLDDLGAEPPFNDFGVRRELAGEFIVRYHRCGRGRLFVTTNLGGALVDRYSPRVSSRLKDLCLNLHLTGPDKRAWTTKGGAA